MDITEDIITRKKNGMYNVNVSQIITVPGKNLKQIHLTLCQQISVIIFQFVAFIF